ncbi:MAG TPA: hypothetical protein VLK33_15050 [Terriglobales bacterium]|nr:hypothetical protein [Terriglobales bacterium]
MFAFRVHSCFNQHGMPTLVQPFPMRSTILEDGAALRIFIPSNRSWLLMGFLCLWLLGWSYAGWDVGNKLFHKFDLFDFFWIFGWLFGELIVIFWVLRMIAGGDVVEVGADSFGLTQQIFKLGRTKTYRISDMRELRFEPEMGAGRGRKPSRIAFDYGAKTMGFANEIDQAEAVKLIDLIHSRCRIPSSNQSGIKFWQQS